MGRGQLFDLGVFLSGAFIMTSAAVAYPTPIDFDGAVLRWKVSASDPPISYQITGDSDYDMAYFSSTIDEAASLWSKVSTSYFRYARADSGETGRVIIQLKSRLADGQYSSGYSSFDYDKKGNLKRCKIVVDAGLGYSVLAISKTLLHELGHCAGLGHSLIPEAIMSYTLDKNSFALDIDDMAAISRLYPKNADKAQLAQGCAIGSRVGEGAVPFWILAVLIVPIILACYIRRYSTS